ncbi:MAG TPA: hypothetical protein VF043_22575 [Ktedonobacteraceae bacterium]
MKKTKQPYSVWIEAEAWASGTWTPNDTDTDVLVTWDDGSRWVASFITYQHVKTVTDSYKKTGECLSGAYFWTSDMILVAEASRENIEEVIKDLIQTNTFKAVFKQSPNDEEG